MRGITGRNRAMIFLRALIVAFIVAGVLDLLTKRSLKKTRSLKRFVVRAPIDFAALGAIGTAVVIGIFIGAELTKQHFPMWFALLLGIAGGFPGFLLMIAPIKGVWDVIVDDDDITVVKAFIYRRHWKFSKITHGKVTRGGLKVYVEGRKRKAFFVDGMCEHSSNFVKRMKKEGKEIIYPESLKQYQDDEPDQD